MADLTITATSTVRGANADIEYGFLGETVTAGQAVYKSTDGKIYKADSNVATEIARIPIGIALNGGAINQPVAYQKSGKITLGATMTAGVAYYLSDTPGGICPVADIGSGEYPCIIGIAESTTILNIKIQYSGVAL